MKTPDHDQIFPFATPALFGNWLKKHHASANELWVKIYKKDSGKKSVTWDEAVIEALCWGWIDGIKKSFDAEAYIQRFTPRRKGSHWSQRNQEHVARLITEGRMQETGLVHVRAAQADGRWGNDKAPDAQ